MMAGKAARDGAIGHERQDDQSLRIQADYGLVDRGVTAPRHVLATDGREYVVKGKPTNPEMPYVAANELICAGIASLLRLPILPHAVIRRRRQSLFGSEWMPAGTFYPMHREHFEALASQDIAYRVVAFDVFVCNTDRWSTNLLMRRCPGPAGQIEHRLLINDHSSAIVPHGSSPADLAGMIHAHPNHFIRPGHYLREAITDPRKLSDAIRQIENLGDQPLRGIVDALPGDVLKPVGREQVKQFLTERRAALRGVFSDLMREVEERALAVRPSSPPGSRPLPKIREGWVRLAPPKFCWADSSRRYLALPTASASDEFADRFTDASGNANDGTDGDGHFDDEGNWVAPGNHGGTLSPDRCMQKCL